MQNLEKKLEAFDDFVKNNQNAPYTQIKQFISETIKEVLEGAIGKSDGRFIAGTPEFIDGFEYREKKLIEYAKSWGVEIKE